MNQRFRDRNPLFDRIEHAVGFLCWHRQEPSGFESRRPRHSFNNLPEWQSLSVAHCCSPLLTGQGWKAHHSLAGSSRGWAKSDGKRSLYNSSQNPHREVFLAPDTLNRLVAYGRRPSRTGGNMNKLFHLAVWAVNHISNERHARHRRMLSLRRPRQS